MSFKKLFFFLFSKQLSLSMRLLIVYLYLLRVNVFVLQDDFLLIHYDKGPCRNKLGHSRASVIWHRTQVINPSFPFLSLSPPSLAPQHVTIHVLSGSASLSLSCFYTVTCSDRLVLSWQQNRKRTRWCACSRECMVVSVLRFPTKPIMYTFHWLT